MFEKLKEAQAFLQSRVPKFPETVVVMGSGMSAVLGDLQVEAEFSFGEIPHMSKATVVGHAGKVCIGSVEGMRLAVSRGRIHYFEGHPMPMVVFPFRAMALAGAKRFVLTNAVGGLHAHMKPSSLMLVKDHINLMGTNPLVGPNLDELGPRFPDSTELYNPEMRSVFQKAGAKLGLELPDAVYVGLHGPSYETPAEIRMYRQMGGDVVGMSTVPEVIALNHMGCKVIAISCITNLATGVGDAKLDHDEVIENSRLAHTNLGKLLKLGIAGLGK